eukprot:TRINITY_DN3267_c0_g1_i2.p1 TRINITY_DN3267_c0_g1~~TRINITY_DN3267_c0_g1_i2.p1  ORF type:complete len:111 (-),score=0.99 TRINITY_DN3267_c0_g1_i2:239-571(-)
MRLFSFICVDFISPPITALRLTSARIPAKTCTDGSQGDNSTQETGNDITSISTEHGCHKHHHDNVQQNEQHCCIIYIERRTVVSYQGEKGWDGEQRVEGSRQNKKARTYE